MRIGMFADMYLPHVSGVTNHIRLYKAELERQGHEVFVFTYGARDYVDVEQHVMRAPAIPYGRTGWNVPLWLPKTLSATMRTLDVAHAHHPFASCLAALRNARHTPMPVVFTNHTRYDLYSDTYVRWIPRTVRHGAIRRYLMWLNRRVSLTISPSAEVAEWLAHYGASQDRLLVLHNAIDIAQFANPSHRRTKADLGLAEDSFVLCYVGRIAREKNVALLLGSFVKAATLDGRICLMLVGDGPARQECERVAAAGGVADRVRFVGLTPYEEVPGMLSAADAFVTASVTEMYPLVVVEACAAGLPVLGVRSPGVSEIIKDGEAGLLVDEDAEMLARAMRDLAGDPMRTARLREGARRVAAAHEISASARRLVGVYQDLIAGTAPVRSL